VTTAASVLPPCLDAFPGVVLILSGEGMVTASNGRAERELGGPVAGRAFGELVDADSSREKWRRMLARARDTEAAVSAELILTSDGELLDPRPFTLLPDRCTGEFWLVEHPRDARLDLLRDEATGVNSELANTQRTLVKEQRRLRRALAELERSNHALDEFAHAISHDLKAPLRAIGNYATWLREDLAGAESPASPASHAHLQRLDEQVRRMRALIDGAIAYARAGRADAGAEDVDVGALARDIVALLDPPASADIRLLDLPTIRSPRAPLQQVLQNLVDNAIKHAGGRPVRVTVDAEDAGEFVALRVADDGPGIPEAQHERIWGLFNTLQPSADASTSTGIGLALVRRLAEAQGGRASVASEAGHGATFTVLWPKRSGEPTHGN